MEFTGQITFIGEVEEVGENKKKKQTITLEELYKQYPNSIAVDFRGDKTMQVANYKQGDIVTVSLNVKTRESKTPGRFWNSISVWRIEKEVKNNESHPF